ncbi:hypothetical protein [Paenibacillus sp. SSG-1]|uniref:hypothetical protein n=1 Tax=Paenibacillus sp. SSG-1 TaxID=1443669 RepID=UPI001C5281C3|nr:hypothetical protein [Paenibacillus sp. SSG-1]
MNLIGAIERVWGIIGSILGIVLSVFLTFWFRTDPGDIQYWVVIFLLLLPSLLASYAVIKASFSMLLIAEIWTIPLLSYLTFKPLLERFLLLKYLHDEGWKAHTRRINGFSAGQYLSL